ncbi:transcriptional regulator [Streptomyces albiflaviniger]|nr:transcriptional regulator [Streptomyces albiflaviniger]
MDQRDMPTMRSRRLGAELRRLRIEAGLKVQEVAEVLECGQPKVSQIENGKRGIRPLDLTVLLKHYGVEDERQCASLRRLAKEIHKVDWWSNQGPLLRDDLRDLLTLEADSELVRTYESMLIPGLLQTERYMRQTFAVYPAESVELHVETRMKRKELLDNQADFCLRAVIDVPALHRIGGSRDVVRDQLEHLQREADRPNVKVQVLPLDAALPQDQLPPFTIFRQRGEPPADIVWLEHITGGSLLEQRQDVLRYSTAWDELTAAALSPAASQQYIRDLL